MPKMQVLRVRYSEMGLIEVSHPFARKLQEAGSSNPLRLAQKNGARGIWGFDVSQVPKCEGSPPHGRRPVRGDPRPGAPRMTWAPSYWGRSADALHMVVEGRTLLQGQRPDG